jgi:D-alanyl-lipoteichoic acid acyltransferase DltB (MBOAT superfamily)
MSGIVNSSASRLLSFSAATAAVGSLRPATAGTAADARAERAAPQATKFLLLLFQLGLLLLVFHFFRLEQRPFFWLACLAFGGFAAHYWLPFRLKEPFWILLSLAGAFVFLEPLGAFLLLATGLALFALLCAPVGFGWRLGLVVAAALALMLLRAIGGLPVPATFWAVFGAIFMFRMIVYLYDLSHAAGKPSLREYLSYFFLLPNYCFLLFPVIDFRTMRRSYYEKDIHETAQTGIAWMVRGAVQLILYRLVYHFNGKLLADQIESFASLATLMVATYLLYLRVSGQFHIIVGMLHLFGYNLPETNRRYLLAASLTDFWRRINIYWKDFMVKVVYFPAYFRLRKRGEALAQVAATAMVFLVTWFLHGYQQFWLSGKFQFRSTDAVFWGVLGLLVIGNVLYELKHRRPAARAEGRLDISHALHVAGTFVLITFLWSIWNAPSLGEWLDLVTWWKIG